MNKGTPKTLLEAIDNGIDEYSDNWQKHPNCKSEEEYIRLHVQDFLAQKFQVAKFQAHQGRFSTENDLQILFDACTKTSTCVNKD